MKSSPKIPQVELLILVMIEIAIILLSNRIPSKHLAYGNTTHSRRLDLLLVLTSPHEALCAIFHSFCKLIRNIKPELLFSLWKWKHNLSATIFQSASHSFITFCQTTWAASHRWSPWYNFAWQGVPFAYTNEIRPICIEINDLRHTVLVLQSRRLRWSTRILLCLQKYSEAESHGSDGEPCAVPEIQIYCGVTPGKQNAFLLWDLSLGGVIRAVGFLVKWRRKRSCTSVAAEQCRTCAAEGGVVLSQRRFMDTTADQWPGNSLGRGKRRRQSLCGRKRDFNGKHEGWR